MTNKEPKYWVPKTAARTNFEVVRTIAAVVQVFVALSILLINIIILIKVF